MCPALRDGSSSFASLNTHIEFLLTELFILYTRTVHLHQFIVVFQCVGNGARNIGAPFCVAGCCNVRCGSGVQRRGGELAPPRHPAPPGGGAGSRRNRSGSVLDPD